MHRAGAVVVVLLPALTAAEEPCPWREGREPPAVKVEGRRVELRARFDPYWFRCAKKAGGELVLRVFTGSGGKLRLLRTRAQRSYSVYDGVGSRDLCEQDPPDNQVQFELTGKGVMERLSWKSEVAEIFCPRCTWYGADNSLVLRRVRRRGYLLEGKVDPRWHACAREGSTMAIAFYRGESRQEVREAREPSFLVEGLERRHKFKKRIPWKLLCKGGARWVAFELVGTGEMRAVNGRGRHYLEPRCR